MTSKLLADLVGCRKGASQGLGLRGVLEHTIPSMAVA
jgi:hypothetical protein